MEKVNKINNFMIGYVNDKAIYVDDEGNLYYIVMEEEFTEMGSAAYDSDLTSIDNLSEKEQEEIYDKLKKSCK